VVGTTIDFLIVAFVVFLFAKYVLKESQVTKK
jgi:large-conductance mechanosensitive channel